MYFIKYLPHPKVFQVEVAGLKEFCVLGRHVPNLIWWAIF